MAPSSISAPWLTYTCATLLYPRMQFPVLNQQNLILTGSTKCISCFQDKAPAQLQIVDANRRHHATFRMRKKPHPTRTMPLGKGQKHNDF